MKINKPETTWTLSFGTDLIADIIFDNEWYCVDIKFTTSSRLYNTETELGCVLEAFDTMRRYLYGRSYNSITEEIDLIRREYKEHMMRRLWQIPYEDYTYSTLLLNARRHFMSKPAPPDIEQAELLTVLEGPYA